MPDTGWITSLAATHVADSYINWVNPNSSLADDASYATAALSTSPATSSQSDLLRFDDFVYTLPADARLTGIEVNINYKCPWALGSSGYVDAEVQLIDDGAATDLGAAIRLDVAAPAVDTDLAFGSSTVRFGIDEDIDLHPDTLSSSIGVDFRVFIDDHNGKITFYLDHLKMKLHYDEGVTCWVKGADILGGNLCQI